MKRFVIIGLRLSAIALFVAACNIGATQPPATEPPASQVPAAQATGIVSVDLGGPVMELGSSYIYVDGMKIVAVPSGPFKAGDINLIDNKPRTLTVADFWIYDSEVSNQQYALCVAIGKCTPPDKVDNPNFENYRFINHPVVGVTWQQAFDYCDAMHARLATEHEWEKAARGPDGNKFEWGNKPPVCELLNFNFCLGKTSLIQQYPDGLSYYQLYDMAGNVREWVADWYDPGFPDVPPALGEKRSIRSSSFSDGGDFAVAAHRYSLKPDVHLPDLGFRCVVEDPTYFAPWCEQLAFVGSGPNGAESDCTPAWDCNNVSISQGEYCAGGMIPHTVVSFSLTNAPPPGWTTGVPGCVGGGAPGDAQDCTSPGPYTATATGSCIQTTTCDPVCPVHYMKVGDTCVWDGSGTMGTRCIAGATYDPVKQCCSATPGSGINFDLCPDGFHPVGGVCVADPTAVIDVASQAVHFKTCGPGDTPCDPLTDPAGCRPGGCVVQSCANKPGTSWNAAKCCCADTGGVCH